MIRGLALILTMLALWAVLRPLFSKNRPTPLTDESGLIRALQDEKHRFLQSLRDLELDFATGKLSETDYQEMRNQISHELARVIKNIDSAKLSPS